MKQRLTGVIVAILLLTASGCAEKSETNIPSGSDTTQRPYDIVMPTYAPVMSPTDNGSTPDAGKYNPMQPTPTPVELLGESSNTIEFKWELMPREGATIVLGQSFSIEGKIVSGQPITKVQLIVWNVSENSKEIEVSARQSDMGALEYSLNGYEGSLNSMASFSRLKNGDKRIELICSNGAETDVVLWRANFTVSEWATLTRDKIHTTGYDALYELIGDDSFLFKYKLREKASRRIYIDDEWYNRYIRSIEFGGHNFKVHTAAYDKFKEAFDYINSSWICMSYSDGSSTGVFSLSEIVKPNPADGAYVARFQDASMSKISHHSFGTCIDLNSNIPVNQIRVSADGEDENWAQIKSAVSKLTYEGLKTVDGKDNVYCFSYSGERQGQMLVPDALINYIMHELAVAGAGFYWGGYFGSGSDAMHFTLAEINDSHVTYPEWSDATPDHERIQKVFEYAG